MTLLLVGGDQRMRTALAGLCQEVKGVERIYAATGPAQAVARAEWEELDALLFLLPLPEGDPLDLLRELRRRQPRLQVVFVADDERFAMDAWRGEACGYLMNPVDQGELRKALDRARRLGGAEHTEIELSTFGRFDLFLNGRAVKFKHEKARELLAMLTARMGGTTPMDLVIDRLWEGEEYNAAVKVKYRKAVMHLRQALNDLGFPWMLHTSRGQLWMDFTGIKCDYFSLIHGDPRAFALYHGAFMTDFSWSEYYLPMIERLVREFAQKNL